ncbi:50S ribosomal protein L2 [Tetrabaena socialis]|uniref:50S ribosomal protein L2 n=1 Tax=Tetrabaena socialis TaxID=47790 RepID=A0A2J8A459_9CHLO|nr:50S ribosomal protein L2 [Tetrabaena socialis]|eukprot:PNH07299.1 50S ribosomal protein L2 [Tetrabaena socialis]
MLRRLAQSCAGLIPKHKATPLADLAEPSTSGSLLGVACDALRTGGSSVLQLVRTKYTYKVKKSAPQLGETRLLPLDCRATVGLVSNPFQRSINLGKAGARRKQGWRPTVRGIAMNPVDHPHGGRGNGGRPSCTPWGVYTKGKRTRRRNKPSNRMILVRSGGQPIDKFVQAKKWRAKAKLEKQRGGGERKPAGGARR